jgi:membrane protein involved in colicin uptake
MGDAGEGLIDQDSRIQERMEELERERAKAQIKDVRNPEAVRALESLKLARTELERQLASTTHERRRDSIGQAMAELDRRIVETSARLSA